MKPPLPSAARQPSQLPTRTPELTDPELLKLWDTDKKECFADRWNFERQWTKSGLYVAMEQWLAPYSRSRGWARARVGANVPMPVSHYPKVGVQSLRAMLTSIKSGVNVRPTSKDPKAVITAATAQDYDPILRDLHHMPDVMNEFDWSFIVYGNAWLHTYWDPLAGAPRDVPWEVCDGCGLENRSDDISEAKNTCPGCGGMDFSDAMDEAGEPRIDREYEGAAVTVALSPLEIAFPLQYPRWSDVPKLVRMRFRDKSYYENHPDLQEQMKGFNYSKGASERSLQIVQSLPYQSDIGQSRRGMPAPGSGASPSEAEGAPEFECWHRPCPEYPDGLVYRIVGESHPKVLRIPSEGLPGPLPYRDVKGRPLFTFAHAAYEHVGGRTLGSGALYPAIPKIDALNRHDSLEEMIVMGMASPVWMVAKGSEPEFLEKSGRPMIVNWDPLVAGGKGEPKRIKGQEPGGSFPRIREQKIADIEEAMGTGSLIKGAQPAGVEAYSALALLDEISKSRFANAFQARAEVGIQWFRWALELERQYGPISRSHSLMAPNSGWALNIFQKADLSLLGDVTIMVEAGTTMPTTLLGQRANLEHGNQLRLLDPANPDVRFAMMKLLKITELDPGMNAHVEASLRIQEAFMTWLEDGGPAKLRTAPDPVTGQPMPDMTDPAYPLQWQAWYDPTIHRQQCLLWANSDRMVELFKKFPAATGLVTAHLAEIDLAIQMRQAGDMDPNPTPETTPPQPQGAGRAMANSQQNSAPVGNTPQPAMPALNAATPTVQ